MLVCEKCGQMMSAQGKDKIYCSNCQRTDSSRWFCSECRQETGKRFFVEVSPDGSFRCNRCGRKVPNPDFSQKPPPKNQRIVISSQEPYYEVFEEEKAVVFVGLPVQEKEIEWEINNGLLKVKVFRLDFQYEEIIKISESWKSQNPKVNFLNGILSFFWEQN